MYYRPHIDDNVEKVRNAMLFYMHLHDWKGNPMDDSVEDSIDGVQRNYDEFMTAVLDDDKREILAEGVGLINYAWILLVKLAPEELEGVQDWQSLLSELEVKSE